MHIFQTKKTFSSVLPSLPLCTRQRSAHKPLLSKGRPAIIMGGRSGARRANTGTALAVVVAVVALALLSCAVPAVEAKLPKHEDRNVLCEACNATLVELQAMVKKTEKKFGRETAISNAMDELCKDMYNFRVYAFPPPKMKKGCEIIIGEYEEKIEQLLYKQDEDIFNKVCAKEACKGVDMSDKTKGSKMETYVDGKPVTADKAEL